VTGTLPTDKYGRVLAELDAALGPAGVRLAVVSRDTDRWQFELLIDQAACADCVLPAEHIAEIVRFKLQEVDPGITDVEVIDRRQN
jgi:hypothetical protein